MFIGHFAVGLAAKRATPRTSLAALIAAPILLDMLWPVFLVLGIEHVRIDPGNTAFTPLDLHDYPWSHSLLMAIGWSLLFGVAWLLARKDARAAVVLGLLVFSHWILDFVTHRPDMPLYPGSATHVGLGLWRSIPGTIAVEGSMFVAGVLLYASATRARDRVGRWAFWGFVGLLAAAYANGSNGAPPPSVTAIIVLAFVAWLFIPWAAWFDAHRDPRRA